MSGGRTGGAVSARPDSRVEQTVHGHDLAALLRHLEAHRRSGEFVFCTAPEVPVHVEPVATIREDEGLALVLDREAADRGGLDYDFVAAMITLGVRSRLDAVGLTAVVSSVLAEAGISCNVVAGYFHDHLFVPVERAEEALELLDRLSSGTLSLGQP
jgi:uncharacterized protein